MTEQPLAFHASPPAGHWLNDPNGLVHADGAYRLFAQHRMDAPAFRETGWARFSSTDLLRWRFDGSVIPPAGLEWAYSGCLEQNAAGLEALHTAHESRMERQVRRTSIDGGLTWSAAQAVVGLGPPAANRRDPYAFRDRNGWALLLAEPCDWTDFGSQPPSLLRLYRSSDGRDWREAGTIGPWRPEGVMWEVPLLARIDGHDVLFVSEVDRRAGGAACAVRAWIGALEETGFARHPEQPAEGQLVDHGPDFYALMASTESGWPLEERAFVAWLSNWQTARAMPWPGFHGGPISLPRTFRVEQMAAGPRLLCRPLAMVADRFSRPVEEVPMSGRASLDVEGDRLLLSVASGRNEVRIDMDWANGALSIERRGDMPWQGRSGFAPRAGAMRRIQLFVDGPVLEFFALEEGMSASLALETSGARFDVQALVDGAHADLTWNKLI